MCTLLFFKQKTAYEMRISDWSSDVCSSDLILAPRDADRFFGGRQPLRDHRPRRRGERRRFEEGVLDDHRFVAAGVDVAADGLVDLDRLEHADAALESGAAARLAALGTPDDGADVEPEHRRDAVVDRKSTRLNSSPY